MRTTVNETKCTFKHKGIDYTARGAYLDDKGGTVYIVKREDRLCATTWTGKTIASNVRVVSTWKRYSGYGEPYTMRQVQFKVNGILYSGRYGSDWAEACKVKRVK